MKEEDPNDTWLRELASRQVNSPPTEAAILGSVLRERELKLEGDEAGAKRLLEKLDKKGVFDSETRRMGSRWRFAAAAASIVLATVFLTMLVLVLDSLGPSPDEGLSEIRFRGDAESIIVEVPDPINWANRLGQELTDAGCSVSWAGENQLVVNLTEDACVQALNQYLPSDVAVGVRLGRYHLVIRPVP